MLMYTCISTWSSDKEKQIAKWTYIVNYAAIKHAYYMFLTV